MNNKNVTEFFNWAAENDNFRRDSIGDDFVLIENPCISPCLNKPFKVNVFAGILCTKGYMKGTVNLKQYQASGPFIFVVLPGQILEMEELSSDFDGNFILISQHFSSEALHFIHNGSHSLVKLLKQKPYSSVSQDNLNSLLSFFQKLQNTVRAVENPHRIEIITHLMKALSLKMGYEYEKKTVEMPLTKQEMIVDEFLQLINIHFAKHRNVEYYATQMSFNPKYLSKVVRETSGCTASEWIDRRIVLESKALLLSTNLTIQQISDLLTFPNQSFYGKFFKRLTGMSPKDYRNGI